MAGGTNVTTAGLSSEPWSAMQKQKRKISVREKEENGPAKSPVPDQDHSCVLTTPTPL
jgi:hypothetical protein